jgi:hypothetical protein
MCATTDPRRALAQHGDLEAPAGAQPRRPKDSSVTPAAAACQFLRIPAFRPIKTMASEGRRPSRATSATCVCAPGSTNINLFRPVVDSSRCGELLRVVHRRNNGAAALLCRGMTVRSSGRRPCTALIGTSVRLLTNGCTAVTQHGIADDASILSL